MNVGLSLKIAMVLTALSLVAYGLSAYINAALHLGEQSIFNEAWKLIAISWGVSLLAGFAQPALRGIRKGDRVFAFVQRQIQQGSQSVFLNDMIPAVALQDGKVGSKIKVSLPNGAEGEGIILGYAGVFTPHTIKLVETERIDF
ncbi:MAG: hypothetical protein QXR53_00580 [Candidatus Norongarragalinales archaeon]